MSQIDLKANINHNRLTTFTNMYGVIEYMSIGHQVLFPVL